MLKKSTFWRILFFSLVLQLLSVSEAFSTQFYVSATGDNSDGTTWAKAYVDLGTAISNAAVNDTIFIKGGTYVTNEVALIEGLKIFGGFSGTELFGDVNFWENRDYNTYETILSGDVNGDDDNFTNTADNAVRVLESGVANVEIDGLTITGGFATGTTGGGINLTGGSISLENVTFFENYAANGGAYYGTSTTISINNSLFYGNVCTSNGGAIYNNACPLTVTNTNFINNKHFSNTLSNTQVFYGIGTATADFINTIVWNEVYNDGYIWPGENTVNFSYSYVQGSGSDNWRTTYGNDGGNNIDNYPWFKDIAALDFSVYANSPLLNNGNATYGNNIGQFQGAGTDLNEVYVKSDASGTGDGLSWINAYADLKAAIDAAPNATKIYVAKGTYKPHASKSDSSFTIRKGIWLYGGFAGDEVSIDQTVLDNRDFTVNEVILSGDLNGDDNGFTNNFENSWHVVKINSLEANIVIDGFTIAHGCADFYSVEDNKGAGIYINLANTEISNCKFEYNYADYYGGAIYSMSSNNIFKGLFVLNNEGDLDGSSFYIKSGKSEIINSTIIKNGIEDNNESIYTSAATVDVINTIFWDNYPTVDFNSTTMNVQNSLIQGCGASGAQWNTDWGIDGGNNIDEFPFFVSLGENDVRLLANSGAYNTGNVTYGNNMGYFQNTAVPLPDPFYVKADAIGNNDGSDWTNAFTNLKQAIDQSVTTQKIYVAAGTYYPDAADRTVSFYLKDYVEIYGGFAGDETGIDQTVIDNRDLKNNQTILSGDIDKDGTPGGNSYNVFDIRNVDTTAILDGFVITRGYASGTSPDFEDRGAGMFLYKSEPQLRNLLITDNTAKQGGGAYFYTSSPSVINSSFINNSATSNAGAFLAYFNALPEFVNTLFAVNQAIPTYSISNVSSSVPTYENCLVHGSGGSINWNTAYGTDNGNNLDTIAYMVNVPEGDYRLLEISPAISSGDATYGNNIGYFQGSGEIMPAPIYVKADAAGSNNGSDWTNAFTNLNDALNLTVPYQSVYVAKGIYKPHASDKTISFDLKDNVSVYGSFNGDEVSINQTIIDSRDFENNISVLSGDLNGDDDGFTNNSENTYHVVKAANLGALSLLDGFEIRQGYAGSNSVTRSGGGVNCEDSYTIFKNLKIINNVANSRAGGFYIDGGAPKLINSTISHNKSEFVAGGFANTSTIENSVLNNVIIWGNVCRDDYPQYQELQMLSPNIDLEYSLIPGSGGSTDWQTGFGNDLGNNQDTIPYLVSYADNDVRLLDISTLLNTGDSDNGNHIGFYQGVGIVTPELTITESLTDFGEIGVGLSSEEQVYTIAATGLMDDLMINAPENFELSLISGDFSGTTSSVTIAQVGGIINTTNVYIRFTPVSGGVKSHLVLHESYGLPFEDTIRVEGTGAEPTIEITGSTFSFGSVALRDYSDEQPYSVSAVFLSEDLTITAPVGFELTTTSGDYSGDTDVLTLSPESGTIAVTNIYARFAPVLEKYYSGNITHVSAGATSVNKSVNGTGFHAPVYYVSAEAAGANDGSNWENAYPDLQTALSNVSSGDTIVVAKGTYKPSTYSRTATFEMKAGVKVFGGFNGNEEINAASIDNRDFESHETILSGDLYGNDETSITENSYNVVTFNSNDAIMSNTTILDGFSISDGNANASSGTNRKRGGGIYMMIGYQNDCSPLLRNLIIENNTAKNGGGIYMDGAVNSNAKNEALLENIIFRNNEANDTYAGGGALYLSAIPTSNCEPSLKNIVFERNNSTHNGGAVYISGGYVGGVGYAAPIFSNSTFYGNTCGSTLGTAVHVSPQDGTANPVYNNVIFFGNDEYQVYNSTGGEGTVNASYNHCLITGSPSTGWNADLGTDAGGNIEGDPLFVDASKGEFTVFDNSPVIGAGDVIFGANIGYYQGSGVLAPSLTVTASLNDFGTVEVGSSSAEQSFTVGGTNLLDKVEIEVPAGFEISLSSGSGFTNYIELIPSNGSLIETPVYVRFKPVQSGAYAGDIFINSIGVNETLIAVSGYAGGVPEISVIADQNICSSNTLLVNFTVADDDVNTLNVSAVSDNQTVIDNAAIQISGSAGSYLLYAEVAGVGTANITITVSDASLNEVSEVFMVNVASGPSITAEFTQTTCYNYMDASLAVNASGGSGALMYQLNSNGYGYQTNFDYISEGEYFVVVKDEANCTDTTDTFEVLNPEQLTGNSYIHSQMICHNDNNAVITAEAFGGWGIYEFSLDQENFQADTVFKNVDAGEYTVVVRDQGGCYQYLDYHILYNPDTIIIEQIEIMQPYNGNDGEVNVYAYGGVYPLNYALNEGDYQDYGYFSNLAAGAYTAWVKDANGCTVSEDFQLVTVGIDVSKVDELISIYPNPASDILHVTSDLNKIVNLKVLDLSGRIHLDKIPEKGSEYDLFIDVQELNSGTYLLLIEQKDGFRVRKTVVVK